MEEYFEYEGQKYPKIFEEWKNAYDNREKWQAANTQRAQELAQKEKELTQKEKELAYLEELGEKPENLSFGEEYIDDYTKRFNQIEKRLDEMNAEVLLMREIDTLKTYFPHADVSKTIRHALDIGTTNLTLAYRDMTYMDIQKQAAEQAINEFKRQRKMGVESSHGKTTATPPESLEDKIKKNILEVGKKFSILK